MKLTLEQWLIDKGYTDAGLVELAKQVYEFAAYAQSQEMGADENFKNAMSVVKALEAKDAEIAQLKTENERLKQKRAHTRCPECGNEGVYSSGLELLDKLQAKQQECQRLREANKKLSIAFDIARNYFGKLCDGKYRDHNVDGIANEALIYMHEALRGEK